MVEISKIKQLDKNWIRGARYSAYITFGILLLPAFFITIFAIGYSAIGYFIIAALLILFTNLIIKLTYKNFKYELTKDALKIEKGIIVKTYKSIPYARIQNIEIRRGIFARALGYSAISIHTAGYSNAAQNSGPEGLLPGVSKKDAESIREFVIKQIKK